MPKEQNHYSQKDAEQDHPDTVSAALCCQAGFLPVPLAAVPPESLAGVRVFLAGKTGYSLYASQEAHFGPRDAKRLLESGVHFVYVSVRDHDVYYQTMEAAIHTIVEDPSLQQEKKAQILYATSLELANQLVAAPPEREDIARTASLVRASVQLILQDSNAFSHLFETFNHDFYTATHMVNVCGTALALAKKLGLEDAEGMFELGTGSLLHDVGKIFIPNEILNSRKPLTSTQVELVRTHVQRGCEHLERVAHLPSSVMAVVAQHHERLDGSGYPKGLKGDQITPLGRLAGIVDTFDAMTSVRPYREHTFSVADALQHIEELAARKFDREIVRAFSVLVEKAVIAQVPESLDLVASNIVETVSATSFRLHPEGAPHVQLYFRMPARIRRINRVANTPVAGHEEKIIAHRISCTGISFLSPRPVPLEQNLIVTDPCFDKIQLTNLLAVVSACRDHGDGWFTVDAIFQCPIAAEILAALKDVTVVREVSSLARS